MEPQEEDLAFWKAEQALKEGEKSLISQEKFLDALRTQATSLIQWSIAIAAFLIGVSFTYHLYTVVLCIALACSMVSFHASKALEEVGWYHSTMDPKQYLDHTGTTQIEIMEDLARGQQSSMEDNNKALDGLIFSLKNARFWFRIIPMAALFGYILHLIMFTLAPVILATIIT